MPQLFHVDAFTAQPFAGNPAAVLYASAPLPDTTLQAIAAEMNLSETAFVFPQQENLFLLRWFTPQTEVELCGHATLASAHVLWQQLDCPHPVLRFATRSGELTARRGDNRIELNFPAAKPQAITLPTGLLAALGLTATRYTGRANGKWIIEVDSEEQVLALQPDFNALRQLEGRGVMVTARASRSGYDFVSRYFAPWVGVDEDPVTGSNHGILASYWQPILQQTRFMAWQASARGGEMEVHLTGERVLLFGQAVTLSRGEWLLP